MSRLFPCLALSLVLLLTACAASAPGPTAKVPGGKASAPHAHAAPAPRPTPPPAAPAQPTTVIVMGDPLPGVPTPLARPAFSADPKPLAPPPAATAAASGPDPTFGSRPDGDNAPVPGTGPAGLPPAPAAPGAVPAGQLAAPAAATPPTGYAGLSWGSSSKQMTGLTVQDSEASLATVTYGWGDAPKTIFDLPIKDTQLSFFQDQFYHVWIDLDGENAYRAALAALTAAYGPPTSEKPEKFYHSWSLRDVNIYCAYHPDDKEADVSFFYQPIYERFDALRNAKIKAHKPRKS